MKSWFRLIHVPLEVTCLTCWVLILSLKVRRSPCDTWPLGTGTCPTSWPSTSRADQCESPSRHAVRSNVHIRLNTLMFFSYFLSSEEGPTQRHLYRYQISSPKETPFQSEQDVDWWLMSDSDWLNIQLKTDLNKLLLFFKQRLSRGSAS